MRLSEKIIISFILLIILSFFTISLISENMINRSFNIYLVDEKEKKIENIAKEINNHYKNNDYVIYQKDINGFANLENINISVMNLKEQPICVASKNINHKNNNHNNRTHGHNNRNFRNSPILSTNDSNYIEKEFPLLKDDELIGHILIGYIDESYLTEDAILFKDTLKKSFIVSGTIALITGIVISIFLSKSLTNPLVKIKNTANEIRAGNLKEKTNINTNTLEIRELSNAIEDLGNNLAKQEEIRSKYASDIAHELRTPITVLKGYIEAMLDGIWESDSSNLVILLEEIERLSTLVNDLNTSFKSESYNTVLNKEVFDISSELKQIANTFNPIFKQKGYTLETSLENNVQINMDKNKLDQIMHNLLSNSLKHLGKQGKVVIKLNKLNPNNISLIVEDNGIGVKEKDLEFIFNRFYRADESRSKDSGGSGIGLSIVKSFVEAHGGSIRMESEYGVGTRVSIVLPI